MTMSITALIITYTYYINLYSHLYWLVLPMQYSIYFGFNINFSQLLNIFFSSIFLTFAYLFSVLTIYYAPLSLTATARYSVIIFGMIFGYIILKEVPTLNMIVGAVIITLSGIFVIKRQKDLGKIE